MRVLLVLFAMALVPSTAAAKTIHIPTDERYFSTAVRLATDGDTIVFADGVYSVSADGTLPIAKAVTITSANGAGATSIEGASWSITANVTISGLTFRNTKDLAVLVVSGATATLKSSVIENTDFDEGFTTATTDGTLNVSDCKFASNTVRRGGAFFLQNASVHVANSVFDQNTALSSQGGGVAVVFDSDFSCSSCTFTKNRSTAYAGAVAWGFASIRGTSLTFDHCLFADNSESGSVLAGSSNDDQIVTVSVTDSVFVNNRTTSDGAIMSGSFNGTNRSIFSATNTTFYGNTTGITGGGMISGRVSATFSNVIARGDNAPKLLSTASAGNDNQPSLSITHSNVAGGTEDTQSIDADPQFFNAASNDFRIAPTSPCALSGTTSGAPSDDFTRAAWSGTGAVAMGAYAASFAQLLTLDAPATATAGEPVPVNASLLDQRGEPLPDHNGAVSFSTTDTAAQLPGELPLVSGGLATTVVFATPGQQTLTVRDSVNAAISGMATFNVVMAPIADLAVTLVDDGPFKRGAAASYRATVSNSGNLSSSGEVTVTLQLPDGLTLTSASGEGWTCSGVICTRSDVLDAGSSYPAITIAVIVGASAPASVTMTTVVSGGNDANATNDSATVVSTTSPSDFPNSEGDDNVRDHGCSASNATIWAALAVTLIFWRRRSGY